MKRTTIVIVLALVLALALPTVALAGKGGVPASPNGKGRPAAAGAETGDEAGPGRSTGAGKSDAAPGRSGETPGGGSAAPDTATQERGRVQERTHERTEEASGTPSPERHGIVNALSRLEANLARMQAELDAGERDHLPPGLQRVIAKFMSWLGITPDEGPDPGDGAEGGSDEPTGTVEPTITPEPEAAD